MAEPFLSEIRICAFDFAPRGWAKCDGQLLPISQNQALFSLLGTTFGGDGRVNFALPDLRGRSPMHFGDGAGLSSRQLGERAGEQAHTLVAGEMPQHTHAVSVVNGPAAGAAPEAGFLAARRGGYAAAADASLGAGAVSAAGGSQAHMNMAPFLVLNFCIALQGIFPPRN